MLRKLAHSFVPAPLYRSRTAFPALSRVDQELGTCASAGAAVDIVNGAKPDLCDRLRRRFPSPLAEALTLKTLNLLLARYHFRARSASLASRPFGLIVDPSNVCQLACPGCVHSTSNQAFQLFDWPKGTLSEGRLAALLKRYGPYSVGALLYSYGEPLLNLNTPKLIRMAKSYLMRTALSTSLAVRRFDAEAYVESGLDFMGLSIDGVTQPVYERFRRNGDLELVFGNLRKIVDAKRRLKKRYPVLSWNFLAFEHNAHQIPPAAEMARKMGVNLFRVVRPFDVTWDDPEIRPAELKPDAYGVRRMDGFRLSSFNLSGESTNWNPFPETVDSGAILEAYENPWSPPDGSDSAHSPGHTCHWLYKNMVMDATGRIMPCCGAPRPDINLVFGAFDGNGGDPFDSQKYRQARAWFAGNGNAASTAEAPHCTQCEWDHTAVNIGSADIRNYFQAASGAFFDQQSLDMLSGW